MCQLVTELVDGLNNFLAADHPLREISEMRKMPAQERAGIRSSSTAFGDYHHDLYL